jgi:hypothetical protein
MTKIKSTTLDKIKKSPRSADHDIDASAQWTKLILVTYAAMTLITLACLREEAVTRSEVT